MQLRTRRADCGTSLQGPVTWYVQSTGNDSNSGLSRTSPLATIAQAITNYRHGDTIWLIGANTTTGIAPIKWFILDGDRNASLTSTTAGANITLGSGANGSIIRHVAITNSGGSVGDDFGTITITNATNITIEDVPNVTNTNGFYGIKIGDSSFAASNVVLRGVTATGKYRGLGIIDSFVRSTNGNYSGTESGIYMDANNGDCWLYSDSDRGTGSTAAATSVTGPTYHTTAGLFYECHVTDPFAKNHIRLVNPTLKGISTHASYPDPVGSLIGEAATGQSIADIQILDGRSIVRNGNSGGVTRHIYPTSISTCQVTDHDHDRTKDSSVVNDGSVIDWARIRNGTTSNALSATTLSTSQQVARHPRVGLCRQRSWASTPRSRRCR
jgi:hypothetical protein